MEPLQKFGFRDSAYERPNQDWVCGWASEGCGCPSGPDPSGRCPMQSECTPVRKGDRYHCTLPVTSGGPCEEGPRPDGSCCKPRLPYPPCQPRRSIRARRGRLGWIAAVFTLAVITVLMGSRYRTWFITPGDLTSAHATISHQGLPPSQSCAACHSVDSDHGGGIFSAAISRDGLMTQSQQCLSCHFTDGDAAAHAMYAHGMPPETLAQLTNEAEATATFDAPMSLALRLASFAPSPMQSHGQMACSQCHREHRGRSFDLKYLSDTQCQSCHVKQFHSFSRGHPEFRSAPETPSIIFDHTTHQNTHFAGEPFSCVRCHTEESTRRAPTAGMLMPFERSCIDCHSPIASGHHLAQIHDASLTVFEVPFMEVDEDAAGPWPDDIATGMDLPLLMRLLLVGDDTAIEPLQGIREEFWEAGDWILIAEPEPEVVTNLAIAIKRAMRELLEGDQSALTQRLSIALGLNASDPRLVSLVEAMVNTPLPQMLEAQPAVQQFMLYDEAIGGTDAEVRAEGSPALATDSGWVLTETGVIEYRQPDHADPFYTALLEAFAAAGTRPGENSADEAATFRNEVRQEFWEDVRERSRLGTSCLKCHNVRDDGRIAWLAPGMAYHHPTSAFGRNDPHLILHDHQGLGDSQQCIVCHIPVQTGNAGGPATGPDWLNFKRLTHESCADCHNKLGATESCVTCHTYHKH